MKSYTRLVLVFLALQAADVVTTIIALRLGGVEQNSLVSRLMVFGSVEGLIVSKILILLVALFAVRTFRFRALRWSNIAFTGIVLWNISIIVRLMVNRS